MTKAEIERIARGLTEAQRDWINRLEVFDLPFHKGSHFDCPATLMAISATERRGVVNCRLTPLGLAVRAYLENSDG